MGLHGHSVDSQAGGRSLCIDVGLLERLWYSPPRNSNHGDVAGLLGDRGTHDPEVRMRGLLGRDHLDNRDDHRRDGNPLCVSHPVGSPSSSLPESVGHHIVCRGMRSARRGPSVGLVVTPLLGCHLMDAQARVGITGGPCGQKWMGAGLPSAPERHSPYDEDPLG